ncbi:MAG: ribosomal RNA small subunit methyltransferase A [Saprospiraceae bacterium]|nr:ribosomal RNA small subunit methyltransferase A [Saprospiraceae bacterium]
MRYPDAKKSFGQHFLKDQNVLEKMVEILKVWDTPNLIEIGPGTGALTKRLLVLGKNLRCIEADRDMQAYLMTHHILNEEQLVKADVLDINLKELFPDQDFILCGNFPYNISSQILIQTLFNADRIPHMIGMFQKEVAMRIIAKPGTKDYSSISVLNQLLYDPVKCFDIPPGAFQPPPKVMSSVVHLRRKEPLMDLQLFKNIQKLIRHAFQFRRKTLRNNLKSYVQNINLLEGKYFDQRAEALLPEEFIKLYTQLKSIEA